MLFGESSSRGNVTFHTKRSDLLESNSPTALQQIFRNAPSVVLKAFPLFPAGHLQYSVASVDALCFEQGFIVCLHLMSLSHRFPEHEQQNHSVLCKNIGGQAMTLSLYFLVNVVVVTFAKVLSTDCDLPAEL